MRASDRQQQIDAAARLVARHHAHQMIEAGVRQFHEWGNGDQGRHILIAVARYLAAPLSDPARAAEAGGTFRYRAR
jgi:hypothetical protein